jgi:hypothetical protein
MSEWEQLRPGAPRFKQVGNRQSFRLGVPVLALFRALVTEPLLLSEQEAIALIERALTDHVSRSTPRWERLLLAWTHFRPVGWITELTMLRLEEPHGWLARAPDEASRRGAYVAVDFYQCGLMRWLAAHDATRLCRVFCACDFVAARWMTGLRFERSGTIAGGAPGCDFRYFRVRAVK